MADPGFIRRKALEQGAYKGLPRMEIKPMGNWANTISTVTRISPDIKDAGIKGQMKVAREIVRRVKGHIRNQDLGWKPLSETTQAIKSIYGLDSRTLYAHGGYYNAIEAWQKGSQFMVFAGVKKGKYSRSYGGKKRAIDIGQVAAVHEFSSGKRVPRRPLWNPTIREMGGAAGLKKMFMGSFLYYLRMKGIPIKPFRDLL